MGRDKESQGASLRKEALRVDGVHDSVDGLALERSPDDGAVADGKLCQAIAGQDFAFGDVKGIHDGDDVVAASAGALDILEQLAGDQVVHVAPEIRRMQSDSALHVFEEEHDGGAEGEA
jgi:hypothetical protein